MSDNIFDKIFNPEYNPFLGNTEAFQKAWQDTLQKNPMGLAQTPEQNIEELDKRIHELKNVENWLSLNLSILQNTIQSLELQRTHLQSFQEIVQNNEALQAAGQQWWNSLQEQFTGFLNAQSAILEQSQAYKNTLNTQSEKTVSPSKKVNASNKPSASSTTKATRPKKTASKATRKTATKTAHKK